LPSVPSSEKKKKNLSRYHGEKAGIANRVFAFRFSQSNNPKENKREDAQKLKALWWSVQKAPRAAAQKRIPFSFGSPKAKPQI
jgi:Skp family chaperone for outer membrane proteins